MRILGILIGLGGIFLGATAYGGESIHGNASQIPFLTYFEESNATEKIRKKARQRRKNEVTAEAEDIILDDGTTASLIIASPIIEDGARVDELNITVITRDITFIAK